MTEINVAFAWLWEHLPEIIVCLFALSGLLSHVAALTPWPWDDKAAGYVGELANFIAGLYGRQAPGAGTKPPPNDSGHVQLRGVFGAWVIALALFVFGLLVATDGCATSSGPQGDASKAVVAAAMTLSALENAMATYCESPTHDADACESARKVDRDAFAAVEAARAVVKAGGDPSESLLAANASLAALAAVLANHPEVTR